MADIYDKATDVEMQEREQALAAQAAIAANTPRPKALGYCLNPMCGEPFHDSEVARLFCGSACAGQFDKHTRK